MERKSKKSIVSSQKPTWKKITRGNIYPFPSKRNKRVKPNEVIRATKEELGKYIEHFELVKEGTGEFQTVRPALKPTKPPVRTGKTEEYTLISAGEGLFNVVSPSGKVMNNEPLDSAAAANLKSNLEKGND